MAKKLGINLEANCKEDEGFWGHERGRGVGVRGRGREAGGRGWERGEGRGGANEGKRGGVV